jgi:hypothetical protein
LIGFTPGWGGLDMTETEQTELREAHRKKTTLEEKLRRIYILADNIVYRNEPATALSPQSEREIEAFSSASGIRMYVKEAMADLGLNAPVRISCD